MDLLPSSRELSFKNQGEYGVGEPTLESSKKEPKDPK